MEKPSRRKVLMAGGTLGALGALTVATPAKAGMLWTWSPTGSVAGAGAGADPRWVWDAEADPVVADLLDHADIPSINALLRTWTTNGQALPAGLPSELRNFMESARQLPSWTDKDKLAAAVQFNDKRGLYLGVLYGLASGMMSTVIPHEARAVYYSKGGANMKDRISKTAKLGYDIGAKNAYDPDGSMIVTGVKTRLVHAAVRHLLPQSPYWTQGADQQVPISQRDIMVTWHSLPTTVMKNLTAWKIPIPADESEGFLHSWQVGAHLLGVRDEYIPASWDEANAQATQVLDPVLAPTTEGIQLANILVHLGTTIDAGILTVPILSSFTRFLLGSKIADWLELRKTPAWDTLLEKAWGPFIQIREGLLSIDKTEPIVQQAYWTFDEFLRRAALLFLSEAKPISIEIPQTNRPTT